jgi:hypothetical protein
MSQPTRRPPSPNPQFICEQCQSHVTRPNRPPNDSDICLNCIHGRVYEVMK